ncbi:hypothetical protein BS78_K341700 [Paspalum vaginatum]|uniref:Uncharacterized protein n=1 Tax=Paspalum vaginatum TaxID=158149 RepID=A0A9W7XDK8_9POAL|nr:hypothetical protein BS78_K341700 [Paspalum vaginatum]
MVKKIKVSPVKPMIAQGLDNFKMTSPIERTSLIARIATKVGALEGVACPYIQTPRVLIDEAYLLQGHILKHVADQSLVYFFPGYTNEILLPNSGLHLYKYRELTLPLIPQEEAHRNSVSGRMTRSRSRNEASAPYQPPHSQQIMQQMYQSGWPQEAGGSGWQSASSE